MTSANDSSTPPGEAPVPIATGAIPGFTSHGDLIPLPSLGQLRWDAASVETSLAAVYSRAIDSAQSAIAWYLKAKRPKQLQARVMRGASIALVALAGIIPMLAQVTRGTIAPMWASIALALAAAAIALDRFFGYSSAWMRYITTELHLRQMLDDFQLGWETERAAWRGAAPTEDQLQRALTRCTTFVSQVNGLVRDETNLWVATFQESLKQLDETMKVNAAANAASALTVVVTNGEQAQGGWSVVVDDGPKRRAQGQTAAIGGLAPGIHTIKVEGVLEGRTGTAEKAITLSAGAVTTLEVTMV